MLFFASPNPNSHTVRSCLSAIVEWVDESVAVNLKGRKVRGWERKKKFQSFGLPQRMWSN